MDPEPEQNLRNLIENLAPQTKLLSYYSQRQSGKFSISVTTFHFFMLMSLLPASEFVYHMHTCCPQWPGKDTGSPRITVSFSWEPPCGSLEEQQMTLITEPLLQPLHFKYKQTVQRLSKNSFYFNTEKYSIFSFNIQLFESLVDFGE